MKKILLAIASIIVILLVGGVVYYNFFAQTDESKDSTQPKTSIESEDATLGNESPKKTDQQLLYLIEEEKLAHDVYAKMNEKWGLKIFGNILQSETTHQNRVLTLLQLRDIPDPRSDKIGVFKNKELQKFYNELLNKGVKSQKDAYEVGKMIEEKDIKDLTNMLSNATATDVIATLEDLRRASENHLRAFNAQL